MCEIKQTKKRGEAGGEIILVLGHANSQGYILFGRIFRKKKEDEDTWGNKPAESQ